MTFQIKLEFSNKEHINCEFL